MQKVSKPSESNGRSRFLSIEEKDKLLAACKISSNPYLYPIVSLALVTGMRFGEITGLTWENIDFNQNLITLEVTKNGERRVIPLTQSVKGILNSIQTSEQLQGTLFKSNRYNNKSGNVAIRNAFLKALQLANIKNFRFHDLRHTAASYLAMQGATQGELMAILGHKTPAMTCRYAHYSQDHISKLMDKVSFILSKQE